MFRADGGEVSFAVRLGDNIVPALFAYGSTTWSCCISLPAWELERAVRGATILAVSDGDVMEDWVTKSWCDVQYCGSTADFTMGIRVGQLNGTAEGGACNILVLVPCRRRGINSMSHASGNRLKFWGGGHSRARHYAWRWFIKL